MDYREVKQVKQSELSESFGQKQTAFRFLCVAEWHPRIEGV